MRISKVTDYAALSITIALATTILVKQNNNIFKVSFFIHVYIFSFMKLACMLSEQYFLSSGTIETMRFD